MTCPRRDHTVPQTASFSRGRYPRVLAGGCVPLHTLLKSYVVWEEQNESGVVQSIWAA